MTTNMDIGGEGLRLVQTVATRDALRRGCCSDAVIDHETVPFRVLVDVARALRGDGAGGCGPYLQDLVRGGGLFALCFVPVFSLSSFIFLSLPNLSSFSFFRTSLSPRTEGHRR